MEKLKLFLKILNQNGYPNPDTLDYANMIGYDIENFLPDLKNEIGEDGVLDFCDKAIHKMTGDKGLKVELFGPNGDEYVYTHIYPIFYDDNESETDVVSNYKWGESKILSTDEEGKEKYLTIEEIIEDTDMGSWSDLDDLMDTIKGNAYNKIYRNCGFGIWWT